MEWWSAWVMVLSSLLGSDDVRWATVLGELDHVRAEAYATADPRLLDGVYAVGSAGREVDTATIDDYARRGAHVVGADLALLSCRVEDASVDRVRLAVVDQLDSARIVWSDGTSRALPRDRPTQRVVTLVRAADGWRIG